MKLKKKLLLSAEMMALLVVLTGCMQYDENKNPTGFIYDYLVVPTGNLIVMLAEMLNGNYGLAIIAITIIVRLAIMPLNFSQIKKTMVQQEKMKYIKPELEDIQFRQKNAQSPEEKAAVSQEMMALYKENNISMTGGTNKAIISAESNNFFLSFIVHVPLQFFDNITTIPEGGNIFNWLRENLCNSQCWRLHGRYRQRLFRSAKDCV